MTALMRQAGIAASMLGCTNMTWMRRVLRQGGPEAFVYTSYRDTRIPIDCPDCLRGAPLISMVKATDLGNLDDPLRLVRLNCSTFWSVLIQRQVRAGFVIIAEIILQQSAQMVVIEDDHVI